LDGFQTIKVCILAPQTTKTFEKDPFWWNISIIPLPCVIFQLKNKKNSKNLKKFKNFKTKKKKLWSTGGHERRRLFWNLNCTCKSLSNLSCAFVRGNLSLCLCAYLVLGWVSQGYVKILLDHFIWSKHVVNKLTDLCITFPLESMTCGSSVMCCSLRLYMNMKTGWWCLQILQFVVEGYSYWHRLFFFFI
jgi:hypothetical protein